MAEVSQIAWCDSSFSPWIGCTKVGPGCDGCYAEALMDKRMGRVKWGAGQPRKRTSEAYWRQPLAWNRKARKSGKPWRVFCGSLCDIFDNEVPVEWRCDLWDLWSATPHLTWLALTKRIGNAAQGLPWMPDDHNPPRAPLPNVWLGATVCTQEEADRDIPKLLAVPAAVRFLSIEPMLGPIDISAEMPCTRGGPEVCFRHFPGSCCECSAGTAGIDWVIVGGESDQPGHRARPFNIEWARDIVRQCKAAGVSVFVKQIGARSNWCAARVHGGIVDDLDDYCDLYESHERRLPCDGKCRLMSDRAGADPAEWPEDLRVREVPRCS